MSELYYGIGQIAAPKRPAAVVRSLIVANIVLFGFELLYGDTILIPFALWPLGGGFQPWQVLTSAFLHGGVLHLVTNLYGLWLFGSDVERVIGGARFLKLYLASVVSAALVQLTVTTLLAQHIPTLGASGGVFGVLVAFAMLFPDRRILLIFPPVMLRSRTFVMAYAAIELVAGVTGTEAGVAHFAHLGGLAGGLFMMH